MSKGKPCQKGTIEIRTGKKGIPSFQVQFPIGNKQNGYRRFKKSYSTESAAKECLRRLRACQDLGFPEQEALFIAVDKELPWRDPGYDIQKHEELETLCEYWTGRCVHPSMLFSHLFNVRLRTLEFEWSPSNRLGFWEAERLYYHDRDRVYLWLCPDCGHEWSAKLDDRLDFGNNCPRCSYLFPDFQASMENLETWCADMDEESWCDDLALMMILRDDVLLALEDFRWIDGPCNFKLLVERAENNLWSSGSDLWIGWDYTDNMEVGTSSEERKEYSQLDAEGNLAVEDADYVNYLAQSPFETLPSAKVDIRWRCPICGERFVRNLNSISCHGNRNVCPNCGRNLNDLHARPSKRKKAVERTSSSPQREILKPPLSETHPHLAAEWHPTLNGDLEPSDVEAGSKRRVWWIGRECGHVWDMPPVHRTRQGCGCPYCANRRLLKGFNDLETKAPTVAAEWDEERNGRPASEVRFNENKKGWFKCSECGGEWETEIKYRAASGRGCPYCSGQRVLSGFNDLATRFPEVILDWDFEHNEVLPCDVVGGGGKKGKSYRFLCSNPECGHEWESTLSNLKRTGVICPECRKNPSHIAFDLRRKLEKGTLKAKELEQAIALLEQTEKRSEEILKAELEKREKETRL